MVFLRGVPSNSLISLSIRKRIVPLNGWALLPACSWTSTAVTVQVFLTPSWASFGSGFSASAFIVSASFCNSGRTVSRVTFGSVIPQDTPPSARVRAVAAVRSNRFMQIAPRPAILSAGPSHRQSGRRVVLIFCGQTVGRREGRVMKLLQSYLRRYWTLLALALGLAAVNQIFSLLDPLIFRFIIDRYATHHQQYQPAEFYRGVGLLLAAAVGVAFVSRVAKNFQDYYVNVITQRLGARIYSDGIAHSLSLPYAVFEDQRSGQTLGKLQKVRSDVEKLVSAMV